MINSPRVFDGRCFPMSENKLTKITTENLNLIVKYEPIDLLFKLPTYFQTENDFSTLPV